MKKIFILVYGVIAYAIFLIAFVYAIGFVGNFYVSKTIDSGIEGSGITPFIINTIILSAFALQHSVMARPAFKRWITSIISPAAERSTYVLLSSLALLLIYWQWQPMTTTIWYIEHAFFSKVLNGLYFFGWFVVFISTFMISHLELFGLAQIFNNFKNKVTPNPRFQKNYLYAIVRHPIMLGFLIAFWATPHMTLGHLMFAIVTTLYIIIAVKYLEEKDLKKVIGQEYESYQKEVPMLIPFTKNKK